MATNLHIIVVNAHTPIGSEVARYAVAMGYDVTGITDIPPDRHEPWEVGVQWISPAHFSWNTAHADAVIWIAAPDTPITHLRQVFVGQTPIAPQNLTTNEVWLSLDGPVLPIEQVAMAALRAAVETEHHGILDHQTVAKLGDAVMLQ